MSKTTGKRGFIPAQPAAAISALDFAATSEAFARVRALDGTAKDEASSDAIANQIAELADRLIGIPASSRAQIAEKVNAFLWLHGCTDGDLSDPATQHRIADSVNEPAKCLLAIYLDLTAGQPCIDHTAWAQTIAVYQAAVAKLDVLTEAERDNGEDTTDEWNEASAAVYRAVDAVWMTRAPDAAAMGLKARLMIEHQHIEWNGDDLNSPAFISRLLAEGPSERFAAALYQDGLALAGNTGPLVVAQPDPFDAEQWLAEVEARTGSKLTPTDPYGNVAFLSGDAATASAELAALHPSHEHDVSVEAVARGRVEEANTPPPAPTPPARLREMFVNGLLNTFDDDGERHAMRANLAAIGLEAG